jgi:hypothetical protein
MNGLCVPVRAMLQCSISGLMLQRTKPALPAGPPQETAMNQFNLNQINDQFASASRNFADTAGQVSRLALSNAEQVFSLQFAAIEQNVNAAFAFWGELAETRDLDGLKTLWPKGVQVARENVERSISTGQEVLGRTVKTNEAIGEIAKGQFERVSAQAKDAANQAHEQVNKAADQVSTQFNKAAGKHGNK